MEASKRFLVRYLDSIIGIKVDLSSETSKGKSVVSCDNFAAKPHAIIKENGPKWSAPKSGWVKLSTDGSYGDDGSTGSSMVVRDDKGVSIFSSCRAID